MSENITTIANVLRTLLKKFGFTEASLARELKIPRSTINHLVCGLTKDPRASTLNALSEFFGVSLEQLIGKSPLHTENINPPQQVLSKYIPIIEWEMVYCWEKLIIELQPTSHPDWVFVDTMLDDAQFGLRLKSESMKPLFQENEILIIGTTRTPKSRDYIIALIASTKEVLFRQMIFEGGLHVLKAINPDFPLIDIKPEDKIIGVVTQAVKKY